jgi:isoleucyl-tRNA synthetase
MKKDGTLLVSEEVRHSYPHCWRCKNPIIFRATEQWFMDINHDGLRGKLVKAIKEDVKWIPKAGEERIASMVEARPDWCLSRQRYWGVPIPAFQCEKCGASFTNADIIRKIAHLTKDKGANVWFEKDVKDIIPDGTSCAKCGGKSFRKEGNILDVWFDSGVSYKPVLEGRKGLRYPADLYLEGSDQHRGWFQAALITSMAIKGSAPYRKVLTHGFVVDGEGKKMSKSVGNVIAPQEVMRDYGADILRLWVASSDYEGDIKLSPEILARLADGYRKIRNTLKYLLSNLYDFDPSKDAVDHGSLSEADKWILSRLYRLVTDITGYYDSWEFYKVYRAVYDFCVYEVSSFYLDVMKDVLYITLADSLERRSAQTAIFHIFSMLTRVMAPILTFTSDEAWGHIISGEKEESVHFERWPSLDKGIDSWENKELDSRWGRILEIRDHVMKFLEEKREKGLIGSSLEARLLLYSDDAAMKSFLSANAGILAFLFRVSQVDISGEAGAEMEPTPGFPLKIGVYKALGRKCPRCWNYSESVGKNAEKVELCGRCFEVISKTRKKQDPRG